MITLTSEKGLVRIESWDDVVTRPGYAKDIDPKTIKLQAIIGNYAFSDYIPCGLCSCHQPHGRGYLVTTQDGRETNIGKDCGKTHFAVDFVQMQRTFDRDLNAMRRREHLWTLKNRLPSVTSELAALKAGPRGATWMHSKIAQLLGKSGGMPRSITNAVSEAMRSNGALIMQRALTKEERATRPMTADIAGLEHLRGKTDQFATEQVGQLEGYTALTAENSLRAILVDKLEPFLASLEQADIDSLVSKDLNALYRAGSDFDPLLARLRSAVVQGARLLRKANIEQLHVFATNQSERRALQLFANALPTDASMNMEAR
jgi:hypothetical protein